MPFVPGRRPEPYVPAQAVYHHRLPAWPGPRVEKARSLKTTIRREGRSATSFPARDVASSTRARQIDRSQWINPSVRIVQGGGRAWLLGGAMLGGLAAATSLWGGMAFGGLFGAWLEARPREGRRVSAAHLAALY